MLGRRLTCVGVRAIVAVGALAWLAACGSPDPPSSTGAPQSTVAAPSRTETPPTAPTTSPVSSRELLGELGPVRPDVEELPVSEPIDWGCGLQTLALIVSAPVVFDGRVVSVGERGEYAGSGPWMIIGRIVEIAIDHAVVGDDRMDPADGVLRVLWPEQYIEGGVRWFAGGPDLDRVQQLDSGLFFAYVERDDPPLAVIGHVASQGESGLSFNGDCEHLEDVADGVAVELGDASGVDMLRRHAVAGANGEDLAELDRAVEEHMRKMDEQSRPDWSELDPRSRVLGPATVPEDVRDDLRVVGASYAVTDLGEFEVIGARTESGVSEPLIASTALPSVSPLYFLEGIDSTVEIIVGSAAGDSASMKAIASVPVAEIVGTGGIEVMGSLSAGTLSVTTLTNAEMAQRLGVDEAALERLRETYLKPPND